MIKISEVRNIGTLSYIRVRWEYYRSNKSGPTQCNNCMHFGHGVLNCHLKPKCLRCGEEHEGALKKDHYTIRPLDHQTIRPLDHCNISVRDHLMAMRLTVHFEYLFFCYNSANSLILSGNKSSLKSFKENVGQPFNALFSNESSF